LGIARKSEKKSKLIAEGEAEELRSEKKKGAHGHITEDTGDRENIVKRASGQKRKKNDTKENIVHP